MNNETLTSSGEKASNGLSPGEFFDRLNEESTLKPPLRKELKELVSAVVERVSIKLMKDRKD